MLREILFLIATQVARAAELLHPLLVDVDYSNGLQRVNDDWLKVDEYYKEDGWRSDKDDKAENDNKGFFRTNTPFSTSIDNQRNYCFYAKDTSNPAYWQFMTSASLKNVQTIIVITYDMELDMDFAMSISNTGTANSFIQICGYGACKVGVNDFSAAPLPDFKYLRIKWDEDVSANFCNVFIYDKRNYVIDATITHNLDNPDSDGYDGTLWSDGVMQGTAQWGWSSSNNRYNNPTSDTNTCVIQRNSRSASTRLSPIMFEMPLHMVIYDIFLIADDDKLRTHIVSAKSLTANSQTITEIDNYVTNTNAWNQNVAMYGGTQNAVIRQISEANFATNHECDDSQCSEWNVKRVIITNLNQQDKWLFLCGVAIMAEPVPCPPTNNNCQNILLQPWFTASADFSYWELDPGSTVVTDAFEFRDSLTDQCFGYSPPANGCTKTFSLWCNHCSNYQSDCGGMSLVDFTAATFTWSIARTSDTTVEKYELSITSSNNPLSVISHRCRIICEMQGQKQNSTDFVVQETCPICEDTVIGPQPDGSSTPVVGTIPLSKQAQYFNWKWFADSVRDCGDTCQGIEYKVWCRLESDPIFTEDLDFVAILGTASGTGDYTLQLLGKSVSLHQVLYKCKIVGVSKDTSLSAETSEFDVMFDACIRPDKSCGFNTWSSVKPAGWVAPTNINVFLDGITQSSTFDYSNWRDYFYTLCGSDVCGTVSWQFIDDNNVEITTTSLAVQPAVSVIQGADEITLTVGSLDFSTVGSYKIRVKGIMTLKTGAGAWAGPALSNIWSYFTVNIVNPCEVQNPCEYTTVVVDPFTATSMVDMTAFFNNIQVLQNYVGFSDTVSNLCDFQCSGYEIDLVYVDTDVALPIDLTTFTMNSGVPAVSVKTKNYAYAGTHTVRIKCAIVQGGATISYNYSNAFDIVLDPCDTKSCLYSTLVPLTAADNQPTGYAIGVDNVAGSTDFSLFQNTCGQACTANPDICGRPTYSVVYKSDSTRTPSFSSLIDQTTFMRQSSQTFDLDDVGVHELRIKVQFDMSVYVHAPSTYTPTNQILYTSAFTVTIDACFPLPCDYNEILLPSFGFTMPEAMYVRTNNEIVSNYFTHYKDAVSLRCSNPYTDLCGAKVYTIEQTDGTAIPGATIAVNWDAAKQLYKIDISSTDDTAVNLYESRIHVSFADTSYTNVIDETSYEFQITIDAAYPCTVINCALNALVKIEETSTEYLLPQNFVVGTDYTWGSTQFDSWNDTKTEYCRGEPGTKNGVYYASLLSPVCDWPIYELVDANTGEDMSYIFGSNNIDIRFDYRATYTSRWNVKVRTDDSSLDGLYDVKLQVRLSADSNPYYSNMFTIEIADPCKPYDCALTIFAPVDDSSPTDVEYTFGSGFQTSQGPLWDNSVNQVCGTASQTLCGPTRFVLHDASTGEPVTFSHLIYSNKDNVIVSLEITDEELIGKTLEVYLVGFGYDSATQKWYGTNGTSPVFEIVINEPEEVTLIEGLSEKSGPFFSTFPPDISFDKNPDGPDPAQITYQLSAVAEVSDGEISSLIVKLGDASDFVEFSASKNEVQFTFELTRSLEAGQYPIKVTVIDDSGQSFSKTFQIIILDNKTYLAEAEDEKSKDEAQFQEEKEPLVAVIESISMTGLLTIQYNRAVLPIKDLTPITPRQFQIVFEQLSDEIDQTEDFEYQIVSMTPANIFVQLTFSRPLEVSQGVKKDRVHVRMLDKLFMVEDEEGKYDDWQDGDSLAEVLNAQWIIDRIQTEYYSKQTSYCLLTEEVPKQVASLEKMQSLNTQIGIIASMLSGLFWGPFGLHLFGFGSMDYSWVLYNNLQLMTIIGQFNLKMPQNIEAILKSMAPEVNYQFADPVKLYEYLRMQSSDNPHYVKPGKPEPYTWYDPENRDCVVEDCNDRRLQETTEAQETFKQSRFYDMGAYDLVLITSSQLVVCLIVITLVAFWGFVLQKSFLHWLPDKIKIAFHYLRNRIFWCLPIRLIMQQYAVITASAMLNLRFRNQQDSVENSVNRTVSIMTLMILTVGLPTLILVFVTKLPIQLSNPDFLKKFDSLILSVDWNNVKGRCMLGFSLYRKAILIWIAIFNDLTVVQFALACYVQEFYVAFLINRRPMLGALRNKVEFFNEIVILGTIFLQCTLTDYVPDPEIRYNVSGWIIVTLIYFQLVFNTVFLMMSVYHECKRIYKILRYYIVMRHRKERNLVHNWTVQELGAHKSTDLLQPYFKETLFTRHNKRTASDLDVIQSLGDLELSEDSSQHPINLRSEIKIRGNAKTLSERQRNFRKMMDQYREADTELPTMNLNDLRDLKNRHQDEDQIEEKFQIDHGDAKDWHALPSDFSNPEQSIQFSDNTEDLHSLRSIEQRLAPDENDFWLVSTRQESKVGELTIIQNNTATQFLHTADDVITERDEEDMPSVDEISIEQNEDVTVRSQQKSLLISDESQLQSKVVSEQPSAQTISIRSHTVQKSSRSNVDSEPASQDEFQLSSVDRSVFHPQTTVRSDTSAAAAYEHQHQQQDDESIVFVTQTNSVASSKLSSVRRSSPQESEMVFDSVEVSSEKTSNQEKSLSQKSLDFSLDSNQ